MKTNEEILDYAKERLNKQVLLFKKESRKVAQLEKDNPLYVEHYEERRDIYRSLVELKRLLKYITGNDDIYYKIYESIK